MRVLIYILHDFQLNSSPVLSGSNLSLAIDAVWLKRELKSQTLGFETGYLCRIWFALTGKSFLSF